MNVKSVRRCVLSVPERYPGLSCRVVLEVVGYIRALSTLSRGGGLVSAPGPPCRGGGLLSVAGPPRGSGSLPCLPSTYSKLTWTEPNLMLARFNGEPSSCLS